MRIFITGSNGFLAQKFCELIKDEQLPYNVLGVSKSANRNIYLNDDEFVRLDLVDFEVLKQEITKFKPTHILHTAAVTAVEACEEDKQYADLINVALTEYLSQYAKDNNSHFTFISTDFVFDGTEGPYSEEDSTKAVNYYGQSKILAENAVLASGATAAILRTILVYGAIPDRSRGNLVLWAKGQLEQNKPIKVVSDQWRMPTWVDDLAQSCLLAMNMHAKGIFHISGDELMTIEESVYKIADALSLKKELISPITAKELGQENNRPRMTGFNLKKSKIVLKYQPTPFVESLTYICDQLKRYGR
ncbi:SDR family oxidoreductase [Sphingobacterium rhinopitheci]|uniref:SDR family oxidoreductase n=1 Tax=Sphingobacterium rhinopitheci TaxID=2781960 RepID=UPI001F523007|nr:SDR family oxidoreductase [Sphingobacterium rhinopitheci]MCI0920263.1 SDR family oxidoreductase [Sphingobacterium rhinopitheci]